MPFKSKAQQRFMFAAEARGDLPEGTAERWAHHTPDIKALPERAKKKKKGFFKGLVEKIKGTKKEEPNKNPDIPPKDSDKGGWTQGDQEGGAFQKAAFMSGLAKVAEPSLSWEANQNSGWSIGDYMPGEKARENATTGQFKGKSYRTEGVQNEGREFNQKFKQKAQTARGGKHNGGTISKGIAENRED